MDYAEFEESEQEKFLDEFYDYRNTELILTGLTREDYPAVRTFTKKGIKLGVEFFLACQPNNTKSLYLSDLIKFASDDSVQSNVASQIKSLNLDVENVDDYVLDVSQTYETFVFNESSERFRKLF
ncbi:MAG: hypothetical protein KJ771_00225 [Nanoarchaeota archaeon]|nr:hypothetical protein [Nanoarchaeota archaeon]